MKSINELVKIAGELDKIGNYEEANRVDLWIKKLAALDSDFEVGDSIREALIMAADALGESHDITDLSNIANQLMDKFGEEELKKSLEVGVAEFFRQGDVIGVSSLEQIQDELGFVAKDNLV